MVNRVKKMTRWTGAISDASKTLLGQNLSRALSNTAYCIKTSQYGGYYSHV